nr:hypothetical protein [Natronolimnobius sp. AArcel1]
MSDDGWAWELASSAQDDLNALNPDEQQRIIDKPEEIVDSPWRDPPRLPLTSQFVDHDVLRLRFPTACSYPDRYLQRLNVSCTTLSALEWKAIDRQYATKSAFQCLLFGRFAMFLEPVDGEIDERPL